MATQPEKARRRIPVLLKWGQTEEPPQRGIFSHRVRYRGVPLPCRIVASRMDPCRVFQSAAPVGDRKIVLRIGKDHEKI